MDNKETDDYIARGGKYHCKSCPLARGTVDWRKHCQTASHKRNYERAAGLRLSREAADLARATEDLEPVEASARDGTEQEAEEAAHADRVWDAIEGVGVLNDNVRSTFNPWSIEDDLDKMETLNALREGDQAGGRAHQVNWLEIINRGSTCEGTDAAGATEDREVPIIRTDKRSNRVNTSMWFPFKSKLDLVASLIMGHTRSLLSKAIYTKIRAILTGCAVKLATWATVQASRDRINKLLGCEILPHKSVFDTPCFSLGARHILQQELGNPLVTRHLEFYPEWCDGVNISKFSQSTKWLAGLSPQNRPQMCEVKGKHYYIYEPVQLISNDVVIPIFFFNYKSSLHAKCFKLKHEHINSHNNRLTITIPSDLVFEHPELSIIPVEDFKLIYSSIRLGNGKLLWEQCGRKICVSNGDPEAAFVIPNPWRDRARGKIVRNVPIILYADDTSGNVSKQFNKHISFYFTLAGLPPHISNQEYNCHFLSTSNLASVCELSEQIVKELKWLMSWAFDQSISQPVLVNTIVLCFLADSPMHAEITNTPNPGTSLNPCRMSIESRSRLGGDKGAIS
ncbi:uncharacterized protein PGTG_03779 [Puccinia graminis f. sp. tritici CRL 75-36-700-3]|uniref:U1-type domain-containing protein n=1 Tax=Puccinia graminis f. sp. tritici (strain CRL 75-36-700-3 / race SCCL) TaxID=418459 RepID=E3K0J8_PUCGT|nr:uncharacterized protein PGTG_03779 [Puccinia graminis f. sp. tritici CRL 75-36-700-3]EFP77823.2 hypothetical protein PGTG_03779 [Puccinia graminis f. sp. tritici CRL 75-36-700-3]